MIQKKDKEFKIVFLGNNNVGKTSIVNRLCYESFSGNYQATHGISYSIKQLKQNNEHIILNLWDIGGEQKLEHLIPAYVQDYHIGVICFDLTNEESFKDVDKWIKCLNNFNQILIIGNKFDLTRQRTILFQQGEQLAQSHNTQFIEVSANSGYNISHLQECLLEIITKIDKQKVKPELEAAQEQKQSEADQQSIITEVGSTQQQSQEKIIQKLKISFIGDQCSGKSSIIQNLAYGKFNSNYQPTIGIDYISKSSVIDNQQIRFQLWDSAGQERFLSLIPSYVRDSTAVCVCINLNNAKCFDTLDFWIRTIYKDAPPTALIYLICTMSNNGEVSLEQFQENAQRFVKADQNRKIFLFDCTQLNQQSNELLNHIYRAYSGNIIQNQSERGQIINRSIPIQQVQQQQQLQNENLIKLELGTKFKIVFVGDAMSGKTCLINRLINQQYDSSYNSTIGIDFISKQVSKGNQIMKLQIWDTAGQTRFQSLIPSYLREAKAVILLFDITKCQQFNQLGQWFDIIKNNKCENQLLLLVGTHLDQANQREVSAKEGQELANKMEYNYFEISSQNGENVQNMFNNMINELYDREVKIQLLKLNDEDRQLYLSQQK